MVTFEERRSRDSLEGTHSFLKQLCQGIPRFAVDSFTQQMFMGHLFVFGPRTKARLTGRPLQFSTSSSLLIHLPHLALKAL